MDEPPSELTLSDVARVLPPPVAQVVTAADPTAPTAPLVYLDDAATAQVLPAVRSRLARWAAALDVPKNVVDDIVLATDEAMANSVQHAYPPPGGRVLLVAVRDPATDTISVIISDSGRWRPPPADPGSRGRGLSMMRMLASRFDLYHGDSAGTTVLMSWHPAREPGR